MWLKWTKRILASLGILIVLIVGFFFTVVYIYEDEVKQYAVEQLNKHLKVKVKAPDIELTIWDQFPNASLRFNDVLIPDYLSENEQDTMLYAKHIYLSFDFWDMMGGNYKVQTVSIEEAIINLKVNSKGEGNFDIFKEDTTVTEDTKFSFALKEVKGQDIAISYIDSMTNQTYEGFAPNLTFSGNFNEAVYDLKVSAELDAKKVKSGGVTYLRNKDATVDLAMQIDREQNKYLIQKGNINVEELLFDVTGKYIDQADSSLIDLNIKGKNIDLASAITILPQDYMATLAKYKAKGLVVFEAKIRGNINETESPRTSAEFYLQGGSLTELNTKTSISDLSFDGFFDSDTLGTSILYLDDIKGMIDVGQINGQVKVENLAAPKIAVSSFGSIDLKKLHDFIQNENIEKLTGQADFDLHFTAESQPDDFQILKSKGDFTFKNASLKLPGSALAYSQINGDLLLNQNDAAINNFHGFIEDSDFRLDGVIKNLIPYILSSEETLTVEADLRTEKLSLDNILKATEQTPEQAFDNTTPEPFVLPNNIHLNLKSQIENLYYGKFDANQVNGIITLYNQELNTKNVTFGANDGIYNCDLSFAQNPDLTFTWKTNLTAKDIDIENFFHEMDNFGQVYLTEEHIKGKGTITLDMAILVNNDFSFNEESLVAECQINVQKGQLVNQPSLIEIADYFDENKLVKVVVDTEKLKKKLKNVKFSELNNTITIKDSKIYIPKMTLETNVLDLNLSGVHGFNDSIDYHFNFRLRKILYSNKKQEEFGPLVDDELGAKLFLHMYGHLDDPQYELDSEEKHEEIKKNIQEEKKNIKSILKSEVGLFKADTAVGEYVQPKKIEPEFEIEWEEFDEPEEDPEDEFIDETPSPFSGKNGKNKKEKDKGMNKLFKKLGIEPEEQENKVEYEIEQ
jgi:hypothetical protein